tara:strand:+ start:3540 stop:5441 length:1902 start_codon:yes stop_codon:yes gene_type:complete
MAKTLAEAVAIMKKQKERIDKLQKKVTALEAGEKVEFGGEIGGLISDSDTLRQRFEEIRRTIAELTSAGAIFADGGDLSSGLADAARAMDLLVGSSRSGTLAFKQLTTGISNFASIASAADKNSSSLETFSGQLAKQAAIMKELGVNYSSFNTNIDLAINSFGKTKDEVLALNLQLTQFAKDINLLPSTVSRNFQLVAKSMAYDFSTIKDQFTKIQTLSAQTGVAVDTLMGKFGRPMDTISGASSFAARMNAILGENRFSAAQVLSMTEDERMQQARDALMKSSAYAEFKRGGVQGKFALQTVAEGLGMSVDDTRRFLEIGGLKSKMMDETLDKSSKATASFTRSSVNLSTEFNRLVDVFKKARFSIEEQTLIQARGERLRNPTPTTTGLQATALFTQEGTLPGGITGEQFVSLERDIPMIRQLLRAWQVNPAILGGPGAPRLQEIIDLAGRNKQRARQEVNQLMRQYMIGQTTGITSAEATGLKAIPQLGGMRRKALQIARDRDVQRFEAPTEATGSVRAQGARAIIGGQTYEMAKDPATGQMEFFQVDSANRVTRTRLPTPTGRAAAPFTPPRRTSVADRIVSGQQTPAVAATGDTVNLSLDGWPMIRLFKNQLGIWFAEWLNVPGGGKTP